MVWSDRRADMAARPCSAWPSTAASLLSRRLAGPKVALLDWIVDPLCQTRFWNVKAILIAILSACPQGVLIGRG